MSNIIKYSVSNKDIIIDSNERSKQFFSSIIKNDLSDADVVEENFNNSELLRIAAQKEADEIISSANEQKKAIIEQALQEAEAKKKEIESIAMESGYKEGYAKVNSEYEIKLKELSEEHERLKAEYKTEMKRLEPLFAKYTIKCVEKLTGIVAKEYESVIYNMLISSINNAGTSKAYIIHVPREQFDYVNARSDNIKKIVGEHINIEIIADRSLSLNNCKIETDYCIIDAGLDTRLTTLTNSIKLLAGVKE